jgi:hypothetical protein
MTARFELIDAGGVAAGQVDLVCDDGTAIAGVAVDLLMLARNDPGALRFPDGPADPALIAALLPQLRMLVRGRVVPLAAELRF